MFKLSSWNAEVPLSDASSGWKGMGIFLSDREKDNKLSNLIFSFQTQSAFCDIIIDFSTLPKIKSEKFQCIFYYLN